MKFFKDGNSVPSGSCEVGEELRGKPKYIYVAGKSSREKGDEIRLTGYTLWDRILTNEELLTNARSCQQAQGNPVVKWNDFYTSAQTNAKDYLVSPSECNVEA